MHRHIEVFGQHDVARGLHGLADAGLPLDAQQAAGRAFVHQPASAQKGVLAMINENQAQVGRVFHDSA